MIKVHGVQLHASTDLYTQKQFNQQLQNTHFRIGQLGIKVIQISHLIIEVQILKIVKSEFPQQFQRKLFFLT